MPYPKEKIARRNYYRQVMRVQPSNLEGFWRMNELGPALNGEDSSLEENHGTYSAGTMMAQGKGPDGHRCPLFGSGVVLDIYSAGLNSDLTMAEISGIVWAQPTPSFIAGTTAGRILSLVTDANNNLIISHNTTANQIQFDYQANNTDEQTLVTLDTTEANDWHCWGFTVSDTGDIAKFYKDGVLQGTDTGIGTWSGALNSDTTCVGSSAVATPANVWTGYISLLALWSAVLTDAEHALIGTMKGLSSNA